jgi:hypothetical protein
MPPEPSGSKPWRDPAMMNYGGPRAITSSLATSKGLCTKGHKCFRKDGHLGDCYPLDDPGDH